MGLHSHLLLLQTLGSTIVDESLFRAKRSEQIWKEVSSRVEPNVHPKVPFDPTESMRRTETAARCHAALQPSPSCVWALRLQQHLKAAAVLLSALCSLNQYCSKVYAGPRKLASPLLEACRSSMDHTPSCWRFSTVSGFCGRKRRSGHASR